MDTEKIRAALKELAFLRGKLYALRGGVPHLIVSHPKYLSPYWFSAKSDIGKDVERAELQRQQHDEWLRGYFSVLPDA